MQELVLVAKMEAMRALIGAERFQGSGSLSSPHCRATFHDRCRLAMTDAPWPAIGYRRADTEVLRRRILAIVGDLEDLCQALQRTP